MPAICVRARHAKGVLGARVNNSDPHDAEGLAQLARTGWYKARISLLTQLRGLLKLFGLRLDKVTTPGKRTERLEALFEQKPELRAILLQTSATASATTPPFLYAGDALVGEYDGSGTILRRYVPGPGTDEPLVWYEGAGTGDRRWLHADTRNSVIGYSDSSGNSGATYAYDPYGLPDTWSATASRYRYTGQTVIPEAHLYDYKARMYDPMAGRFLQTDPVGYDSDINLYAYAGNDPINWGDPSGLVSAKCASPTCKWINYGGGGYSYNADSDLIAPPTPI